MLPTLLIVDDERSTREGLRSALEEEFDVYTAAGTGEALTILKSSRSSCCSPTCGSAASPGWICWTPRWRCRNRRWRS
jgi:CheY-like chemotaxis protein